jgi:isocitrate dehydrogenase (NAD+)
MGYQAAVLSGDGIGPEVTKAACRIVDSTPVKVDWIFCPAGADCVPQFGKPLPDETLDAIRKAKVALKGPIGTPIGKGFRSVNVELRQALDLYANFRPAKSFPGIKTRYPDVDVIVVRENTEGLYSGAEHQVAPGVVESFRIITKTASERIVRFAFDTAVAQKRKKVTAVHKANILKLSDGLFLDCARKIAADYPEIAFEESIVDATAMKLVLNPNAFDVMVMENLFGDILSDLTAGLIGGLGLAPSGNFGDGSAVFEAVHGTAPDIAGKGFANPTALIMSAALMLRFIGEESVAGRVEHAVRNVLAKGKTLTRDLGGDASTDQYANAVIDELQRDISPTAV